MQGMMLIDDGAGSGVDAAPEAQLDSAGKGRALRYAINENARSMACNRILSTATSSLVAHSLAHGLSHR